MTNEELQKAFEAGYAAAKALYSMLEKEGIEVTEADIRRIVEEVIGELAENGKIGKDSVNSRNLFLVQEGGYTITEYVAECSYTEEIPDVATCIIPFAVGSPNDIEWDIGYNGFNLGKHKVKVEDNVALVGNPGLIGMGEDNGVNFCFLVDYNNNASIFANNMPGVYRLIGTRYFLETTPISDKYLPGACLPVVELTTNATEDGAELTAEETAVLSEVLQKHDFAIVKFNVDGFAYPRAVIASKQVFDDLLGLLGSLGERTIFLTIADGVGMAIYAVV